MYDELEGFDLGDISDDFFVLDVEDDEEADEELPSEVEREIVRATYAVDGLPELAVEKEWEDMDWQEQGVSIAESVLDRLYEGQPVDTDEIYDVAF